MRQIWFATVFLFALAGHGRADAQQAATARGYCSFWMAKSKVVTKPFESRLGGIELERQLREYLNSQGTQGGRLRCYTFSLALELDDHRRDTLRLEAWDISAGYGVAPDLAWLPSEGKRSEPVSTPNLSTTTADRAKIVVVGKSPADVSMDGATDADAAAVRDLNAVLAREAHARNAAFERARDDANTAKVRHEAEVAAIAARNAARAAEHARQVAEADAARRAYETALATMSRPKAPQCDAVPIYLFYKGISIISRADAERDALATCAKAGKSCRIGSCMTLSANYNSCEAVYDTGKTRCKGGPGSKVSSQ